MSSIAFALPIAKGKQGTHVREFIDQLLDDKAGHFQERMKSRGYTRFQVFHQQWPVEQFVVYTEADDVHSALRGKEDDGEFEVWFRKQYEELTGHHVSKIAPHISELVMDWHHEKGGSRTHHS